MTVSSSADITGLLVDWSHGDQSALEKLLPIVEKELHRLAHSYMRRENPNHTLQTTALVNEAYLKLIDQNKTQWQNRAHFFGIAARIMRRILMNYARDQQRLKRGGGAVQVSLSQAAGVSLMQADDLLILNDALDRLMALDERKAQVVEMRYFGGLSVEEISQVLGVSEITVTRDWKFAQAWLFRYIECQSET